MTSVTIEHIILGAILGAETLVVAVIGYVILRQITARLDRTLRVLGSLIVQESEKVQALLRD